MQNNHINSEVKKRRAFILDDLIKISYEAGEPTVSARDLHEGLGIETPFKKWIDRMCEYGFEANKDFWTKMSESNGGRPATEYDITVDMAKQICMLQRTEIGMKVRQYFLDLEKAWNTPEQIMARALRIANNTVDSLKERCKFLGGQVVEQQRLIEELQPKASYYDMILQCKDLIATTIIAKDYGMSASGFNKMLKNYGIQYKQGDTWVLYSKYQGYGYLQTKTHNYADTDGVQHARQHSYWTQKGRLFLYEKLKNKGVMPLMEQAE